MALKCADKVQCAVRAIPDMQQQRRGCPAVTCYNATKHSKHIELHVQSIKQRVELGQLEVTHVAGADNPADMLTKPLSGPLLLKFCTQFGGWHLTHIPVDTVTTREGGGFSWPAVGPRW